MILPRPLKNLLKYELTRSSSALKGQIALLDTLTAQQLDSRQAAWTKKSTNALGLVLNIINHYEKKIDEAGAKTASAVMGVIAGDIEANGVHGGSAVRDKETWIRDGDSLNFARFACLDGLALMP